MRALRDALVRAASALPAAPMEAVVFDLRDAVRLAAELLGHEVGDAVLDRIFATFCVGK